MSLIVTIPNSNSFYSLFSDGDILWKKYDREKRATFISYRDNAVIFLYYTYPTHREACVIRNTLSGGVLFPGLSQKTVLLFSVHASKVDKLKRAASFLGKNFGNTFLFSDGFYIRLSFLLSQRGRLNYPALRRLAESSVPDDSAQNTYQKQKEF